MKYFRNMSIMPPNAVVIKVVCLLLCLTFNYTFPLHREGKDWNSYNNSRSCPSRLNHQNKVRNGDNILKRNKGNSLLQDQSNKNALTDDDILHFEQLVIMKKYPYLDLKEVDFKYSPTDKKTRESVKFDAGPSFADDIDVCEPLEGPNVEITNRGLSGFAIPAKIVQKDQKILESKQRVQKKKFVDQHNDKTKKETMDHDILRTDKNEGNIVEEE